ncbi:MAG: PadR family transcriptional regulator [Rhodobiaceae bacterium]|nr:PadR family transcriptional regulator [Rhodobiaceae bacterium]MCC0054276.1 PadR family transcriptional regulator [Rhodobiaceae bacterium]
MSLKFALLGLISIKPASGYDLKRTIERSIYYIWNATSPQIYATLRKLREEGFITSESLPQQGKPDKQMHTITAEGESALAAFVREPIHASVTRDEVLLRVFLGNFIEPQDMRGELLAYLDRVREERAYLESVEARIRAHPGPRAQARTYQLLSLRLKVAQLRATETELMAFCEAGAGAKD